MTHLQTLQCSWAIFYSCLCTRYSVARYSDVLAYVRRIPDSIIRLYNSIARPSMAGLSIPVSSSSSTKSNGMRSSRYSAIRAIGIYTAFGGLGNGAVASRESVTRCSISRDSGPSSNLYAASPCFRACTTYSFSSRQHTDEVAVHLILAFYYSNLYGAL